MCDKKNDNASGFIAGTLVGAAIGALAALILSPTTPADNRKKIADSAKKYKEKGSQTFEELKVVVEEKVEPVIEQVEQKLKPFIDKALRVEQVVEDVSEKVQQLVAPEERSEDNPTQTANKKRFFKGTRK